MPKIDHPETPTDAQWRELLSPKAYQVLRKHGTERAFTGATWDEKRPGTWSCAGCARPVFTIATEYESGTGWTSLWQPISPDAIGTKSDRAFFMRRTEVDCARCKGHLGHVFEDGPKPTGLRYCMNSAAMVFEGEG